MKGILKFLYSRYFLSAICILLEVSLLLMRYTYYYTYFIPGRIISYICCAFIVLYVINRDEIPEFKLPWMIILLAFPLPGVLIFLLFSSTRQDKKSIQDFTASMHSVEPYLKQDSSIEYLKEKDTDAYVQAKYLCNATHLTCYGNSKVTYYHVGEDFQSDLLESLRKAEYYIFMEYFIIQEGMMWNPIHDILKEKASQGVLVCVMYDDLGCMATLPGRYYKQLNAEGIHCIPSNKFLPVFSRFIDNRDHRKITVVDGKTGFTGGINLADEYINAIVKYGHWKDTAVKIEGSAVKSMTALFLSSWNVQSKKLLNIANYMESKVSIFMYESDGVIIPFGDGPKPLYQERVGKNVYINMINAAKEYIYITTPYIICDHEIMNSLRLAGKKGVDVRIITPHIPDKKSILLMTRSSYEVLLKDGVKIYEYTPGFIHAKNFVCDDKLAVCGTINLDYRSLAHHFECGIWMYGIACIGDMKQDFLETAYQSTQITSENFKLKWWQRFPAELMKVFAPLL